MKEESQTMDVEIEDKIEEDMGALEVGPIENGIIN